MPQCIDAFSKDQQWCVDVSCFFQTLSCVLSLGASLWTSKITKVQPNKKEFVLLKCCFIKVVFLLCVSLKLGVSLTHWLCEPLETLDPQSLINGWRKCCGCKSRKQTKQNKIKKHIRFYAQRKHLGHLFAVHSLLQGQCSVSSEGGCVWKASLHKSLN